MILIFLWQLIFTRCGIQWLNLIVRLLNEGIFENSDAVNCHGMMVNHLMIKQIIIKGCI